MIGSVVVAVVASLVVTWLAFIVVLLLTKPDHTTLRETARLIPDTARLIRRLGADRTLRRGVRIRLWFLLAYLALPIDIVPDFIPVVGYADDAIITGLILRNVVKRAGPDKVCEHWPGTPEGLATLSRLCRLPMLSPAVSSPRPDRSVRAGFALEGITLGWNVVGIAVLTVAGLSARSVALGGFALDSLIEIAASSVVIWELAGTDHQRQHRALRLIGIAFIVLAVYLAIQSTYVLVSGHHAKHSTLGIVWTAGTAVVMFGLALGKTRVGRALQNPVLLTEGRVTLVDAFLATAVLVGLVLNASLDWWWADPLAGYVILFYGLREGVGALRSDAGVQP